MNLYSLEMKLMAKLKPLIDKVLSRFGYELSYKFYERWQPGRAYWEADYIKRLGFTPRTIVDVGVAYGTPSLESHSLYEAFPESYFVLIEPLKEFEPYMQEILKKYGGEYFLTAVGARDEMRIVNINPRYMARSSFFLRNPIESSNNRLSQRQVPVTTLDRLMEEHNFQPPFGLKIDTEGFEIQVIEGAPKFLQKTQFVIAEVQVVERFEGGHSFAEFIALMDKHGFSVCDILDIGRADSSEVIFLDLVFRGTR
jgi:FkbM family methyltransferase